jgi:diaminohydroxyphosphoribosylaminopyrimidine deaminase/5-amino-6-(5-phosphoribosylamino)uracil reductase
MFGEADFSFMSRALDLARNALFTTTPNPRVGCVIVRDHIILGEGWTRPPGGNHAEIEALQDARSRGHEVHGATVYVSLEPCNHFGRTPPCTEALIQAHVGRVIAAMEDPNPLVSGKGLERLRAAGMDVRCGLLEAEARELNPGFITRMTRGLPWVRMKVAASLDGKTALADGTSQWITSPGARADGHVWRARACAVLTGIGTVLADDPLLNVRHVETTRQPIKVVIDSRFQIPEDARLLDGTEVLIAVAEDNPRKAERLAVKNAHVLCLPDAERRVDLVQLLRALAARQLNEIHVEAGARLNGALVRAGCVDEILLYLAPKLIGTGADMFNLPLIEALEDAATLVLQDVARVGEDVRILARFAGRF